MATPTVLQKFNENVLKEQLQEPYRVEAAILGLSRALGYKICLEIEESYTGPLLGVWLQGFDDLYIMTFKHTKYGERRTGTVSDLYPQVLEYFKTALDGISHGDINHDHLIDLIYNNIDKLVECDPV